MTGEEAIKILEYPVKKGSMEWDEREDGLSYYEALDKVRVQGISMSVSGRTILHFGGYPVECAWGDGCGKDWFLTSEEAEAALKGGKDHA